MNWHTEKLFKFKLWQKKNKKKKEKSSQVKPKIAATKINP